MIRNPIVQALGAMMGLFAIAILFVSAETIRLVLDCYTMVGCVLVLARYHVQMIRALRVPNPNGAECLIVSIGGIALSLILLRVVRIFWDAFDVYWLYSQLMAAATAILVFSLFLKVIAPTLELGGLKYELSPWAAMILAVSSGTILSAVVLTIRALA